MQLQTKAVAKGLALHSAAWQRSLLGHGALVVVCTEIHLICVLPHVFIHHLAKNDTLFLCTAFDSGCSCLMQGQDGELLQKDPDAAAASMCAEAWTTD